MDLPLTLVGTFTHRVAPLDSVTAVYNHDVTTPNTGNNDPDHRRET